MDAEKAGVGSYGSPSRLWSRVSELEGSQLGSGEWEGKQKLRIGRWLSG